MRNFLGLTKYDNETNRGREERSGADDTFVLPEERGQSYALPELPGAVGLRTGAAGSVPLWGGEADLSGVSHPLLSTGNEGANTSGDALGGAENDFVSSCRCHQACGA